MKEIAVNEGLVSMCGLYCAACRLFLKGKCKGCAENTRAAWCKVRTCCLEGSLATCADCREFEDPADCKKFNNFFGRVAALLLNSDRRAGILMIKEKGRAGFADHMAGYGRVAIRRRG